MSINDPDVRRAIETLIDEFQNKEAEVKDLEESEMKLSDKVDELESEIEELTSYIAELEEALAEAHLTSESEDEVDTSNREADKV